MWGKHVPRQRKSHLDAPCGSHCSSVWVCVRWQAAGLSSLAPSPPWGVRLRDRLCEDGGGGAGCWVGAGLEVAVSCWRLEEEPFIMLLCSETFLALPMPTRRGPGDSPPSFAHKLEASGVDGVGFLPAF